MRRISFHKLYIHLFVEKIHDLIFFIIITFVSCNFVLC
jgi:hypothetical protein